MPSFEGREHQTVGSPHPPLKQAQARRVSLYAHLIGMCSLKSSRQKVYLCLALWISPYYCERGRQGCPAGMRSAL